MTRERQVAQALSEGLNCPSAIVESLDVGASVSELPTDEWLGTLCAMGDAFDAILSKEVTTTLVVRQADCDFVRRFGRFGAGVDDYAPASTRAADDDRSLPFEDLRSSRHRICS